jgi:hypothetical protein
VADRDFIDTPFQMRHGDGIVARLVGKKWRAYEEQFAQAKGFNNAATTAKYPVVRFGNGEIAQFVSLDALTEWLSVQGWTVARNYAPKVFRCRACEYATMKEERANRHQRETNHTMVERQEPA